MPPHAADLTAETYRDLARARRVVGQLEDETLRTQVEVAQIAAPTGDEHRRADWVAERFRALGLRTDRDDAGNVVAHTPGAYAGAPVVVCAHLDTVFPADVDLVVRRDGSRYVGPGICDNGRGIAVMLTLARVLPECGGALARAVEFVATTGEEGAGDLRGARHYLGRADRAPFAVIAIDGAGDERIVNTGLGCRRFRVTYRGPGGHSWSAYGTANPVHAAARAVAAITALRVRGAARSTLTVSRIGGGVSVNTIPEQAWFEVDARSTDGVALGRMEAEIRAISGAAIVEENSLRHSGSGGLTGEVERIGDRPSGGTSADSPLVHAALIATRLVGRVPELATASTDANAAMALGVPAIAIGGGGRGGDAHSTREWFDATGGTAGMERALTIVATMARIAAD
ncbi:MAG TPA: M20/M25/M40 family metallo-hydrolase [Gemmatimonadaceae bacterium]|nr:M20/M25/M40 family metallo-hydrolase [Gemmatimonadaceae bacterium]